MTIDLHEAHDIIEQYDADAAIQDSAKVLLKVIPILPDSIAHTPSGTLAFSWWVNGVKYMQAEVMDGHVVEWTRYTDGHVAEKWESTPDSPFPLVAG